MPITPTGDDSPTTIRIPQIAVPEFWLSNFGKIQNYLRRRLTAGTLHDIGTSSLGYPLQVVEYERPGCVKLGVFGGTHGHEPGTNASCMNLIHLLETGRDLANEPHDDLLRLLEQVHLYIVPCVNPDGRTVCPDSFYCQAMQNVVVYSNGLQKDGSQIPYDCEATEPCYYFDPADAIFVGGQFVGSGYAANRRLTDEHSDAVEVQALIDFVRDRDIDAIFDLHACGNNFAIQTRSHEAPYWPIMREWQTRAEALFGAKWRALRELFGDGDPPEAPGFFFNAALFHKHAQLMFIAYEGRQGYIGHRVNIPMPTEWEIIDDYLGAIEVFVGLGIEEQYAKANREVFGTQ